VATGLRGLSLSAVRFRRRAQSRRHRAIDAARQALMMAEALLSLIVALIGRSTNIL
jgi:hypothetical protein